MNERSIWTGRRAAPLIEVSIPSISRLGTPAGETTVFVEPEHEAELRRFAHFAQRNGRRALALLVAGTILALVGALLVAAWPPGMWLVAAATLLLGVTIVVFPFATPETVAWLGLERSRLIARIGGAVLITMALWVGWTAASDPCLRQSSWSQDCRSRGR